MSLTSSQQFRKLFREAENILVLLPKNPSKDALASACALAHLGKKRQKKLTVAADTIKKSLREYAFLPQPETLAENLVGARDFVLSFDTKHNKIISVRTQESENAYRIFITPERGSVDPRDFSFIPASFVFQLVIVLDAPDKESLGKLYEENADIFYEVPVINIDHHPKNENFGQINLTDITASSTAEILTSAFEENADDFLDKETAQCLLTGIISATESFQKKNTTPKALQKASLLIDRGANRHEIVQHLYKTEPLHRLKLWGLAMSKLEQDESIGLIWTSVCKDDLDAAGASADDLHHTLDRIKSHHSSSGFFCLIFTEKNNSTRIFFQANTLEETEDLAAVWNGNMISENTLVAIFDKSDTLSTETKIRNDLARYISR